MRSWNVMRHLGRHATVHLASFADDEDDAAHLPALREAMQGSLGKAHVEPVDYKLLTWAARALWRRSAIGVAALDSRTMRAFVDRILAERPIAAIYAYSVHTAQFVPIANAPRFVMDFVDFDSLKYADYAGSGLSPGAIMNRWEAHRLFAMEKEVAARAQVGLFVTEAEATLFRERSGLAHADIRVLQNGIDLESYDPEALFAPLAPAPPGPLLVFTGQMSYRPNVEGVLGFASDVLPLVRAARPDVCLAIVGRRPAPAIEMLRHRPGVIVTGQVPDVRPWLAAAAVAVAPLAIARGIQNKVLEAMAMARPVVASTGAFQGIDAVPGRDLVVADGPEAQAEAILALLADTDKAGAIGRAGRRRMVEGYSWDAQLAPLAGMLGLDSQRQAA
jgi:sugar transferase (PEP-CTERM/EpsH1 system associated)